MTHLPILPVLVPLVTGALMLIPPFNEVNNRQRALGTLASLIMLAVAALLVITVDRDGTLLYAVGEWQPPFGILLVVDRLSAILLLLTSVLVLAVQLYASGGDDAEGRFFQPLLMFQAMGIQGAFLTGDIFNLFVFFEVLLIASYGLVIHGGGKQKTAANLHYVILNLAGSALFLIGLGILYGTFGTLNMADMARVASSIEGGDLTLAKAGALLLVIVFGLKSAMLPLHFWLPKTYAASPAAVAALFAIMTKVGIYSLWRVHGAIFGEQAGGLANVALPWLWPLAWLTLLMGIIAVLASQTLRSLAANLVIISVGSLLLMVAMPSEQTTSAGLYYLLHSTLATALVFLLAGMIVAQRGKAEDRFVAARAVSQPLLLGSLFFVAALALIGMPPLSGFIGKALMMKAALQQGEAGWIWPPLLLASLAALLVLSRAGSTLFWRVRDGKPGTAQAHPLQLVGVGVLLLALVLMVVGAGWLTDYTAAAAQGLYQGIDTRVLPTGGAS
ncbi:monovalent cation/H+ antiporter subunit D [Oceanobacter mangrovi]|uniref:monovalent cation/H+ antiporter subunit D n=1 Tax=Oceanobacter mangrovi TaxID=2862510 RepID=UPI001C8EF36B|nr:monovalent cation/H+ antiporter subunit D [Oceanobacter mangrovi]